jgi:hypothetical protein
MNKHTQHNTTKNTNRKLLICNSNTFFNQECLKKYFIPKHVNVTIPNTSPEAKFTKQYLYRRHVFIYIVANTTEWLTLKLYTNTRFTTENIPHPVSIYECSDRCSMWTPSVTWHKFLLYAVSLRNLQYILVVCHCSVPHSVFLSSYTGRRKKYKLHLRWNSLPSPTPPPPRRILKNCFVKKLFYIRV